ncbi:precorrin-4 C11-methyltransferase [Saccharopolyspora lacisalsi]|uniref:Precorrin-4 C11-methyltransferase n=1 Tax=Halosaccharopolyspora lacisalsi TaxID=1000566 RepID=A0A839DV96_9PSEU|nr:cobalt-precorrin-4/precorrin-4 C(11)-methyltransferase [Halosaccharopolyspora lacisalsi]MBA8823317.1 precorrin-4 C11-methyltransferase [Halosaccharopolyspora lacisalsi]
MTGRISFIGAGPGAADLITVRGARRIGEADVVIWAASLVTPECVREHARAEVELVDATRLTDEAAVEIYRRAERDGLRVARLHSGDPALWGAIREQYAACTRMNLSVEIVPGVAEFSAAAASVGGEMTSTEFAPSAVITRLEGGRTSLPTGDRVREFVRDGTTLALSASAARTGELVEELRAGGHPDDVPVVVAYKVSWPDELVLRTTLGELESTVKQHKLWRHTLFLVGRALTEGETRRRYGRASSGGSGRAGSAARRFAERGSGRSASSDAEDESRTNDPEAVPRQRDDDRGGRPDSDVAWWAVRDWQQSARGATRIAADRVATRRAPQPDLFGQEQPTETTEDGATVTAQDVVAAAMRTGKKVTEFESAAEPERSSGAGSDAASEQDSPGSAPAAVDESAVDESAVDESADTAVSPDAAEQQPVGEETTDQSTSTRTQATPKSRSRAKSAAKQGGTRQTTSKSTTSKSGAKSGGKSRSRPSSETGGTKSS